MEDPIWEATIFGKTRWLQGNRPQKREPSTSTPGSQKRLKTTQGPSHGSLVSIERRLTLTFTQWGGDEPYPVCPIQRHSPQGNSCRGGTTFFRCYVKRTLKSKKWVLSQQMDNALLLLWGKPHLDLFAWKENAKFGMFCTRTFHPEAVALDACSFSWTAWRCMLSNPLYLIHKVLLKIMQSVCRSLSLHSGQDGPLLYPRPSDQNMCFPLDALRRREAGVNDLKLQVSHHSDPQKLPR